MTMDLTITHHTKKKCVSLTYGDNHQWTIFDVEEGSGTLELFGRIKYALEHNFKLELNEEE